MRKTFRRGMFLTATTGFALLGFGLGQASAAVPALPPAPSVPSLPTLPTPSLTALPTPLALPDSSWLTGLGDTTSERSGLPAAPSLPKLPSAHDLPALGGIADLPGLTDLLPESGGLTELAGMDELPALDQDTLPTADLPTGELGLPSAEPGDLPVGVDPQQLPDLPQLPAESGELTKAPVVQLPTTNKLPVVAQVDHNDITHKLVPNTDGVDVQGLPKPQVPDVASTPGAVKLPTATPQTPGMQSIGLPSQLPLVSDVDTTTPSIDDLTGGTELPTTLPELPAV